MKIWDKYTDLKKSLSELYPQQEARSIAMQVVERVCGIEMCRLFVDQQLVFEPSAFARFEECQGQLLQGVPLQYVLGSVEFCGREFHVEPGVLIPRLETEELVGWMCETLKGQRLEVLDVGTGSGCIAVSLALGLPDSMVSALDVSQRALSIAAGNSARLGAQVRFFQADVLGEELSDGYDVIVSNPPYVLEKEKKLMRDNVLRYEPREALFVPDDDPLLFYRRIAQQAAGVLREEGSLWFEINECFGQQVVAMLQEKGFEEVTLRKDIFDKDRMIKGIWRKKCT